MPEKKLIRFVITDRRKQKSFPLRLMQSVLGIAAIIGVLFGPGLAFSSAAMQWAGFIIMLVLLAMTLAAWDAEQLTIDEARKRLDELEEEA